MTQGLWTGVSLAGVYGLAALGFTFFYSASRLVNLSYGAVIMLAGLVATSVVGADGNPWTAVLVSVVAGGLISVGIYALLLRPVRMRSSTFLIALTIGLLYVGTGLAQLVWGPSGHFTPRLADGQVDLPGGTLSVHQLLTVVIAVLACGAFAIGLRRTLLGTALRGIADDVVGAAAVGIAEGRLLVAAAAISGGLAGLAAALIIPDTGVDPQTAGSFTLIALTAAVIGGLGSMWGALAGALVLGLVSGVTTALAPEWFSIVQFGLLLLVLAVRPTGLIPTTSARRA